VDTLAAALDEERPTIETALAELSQTLEARQSGLVLREIAGGWRLATQQDLAPFVEQFVLSSRHARLTKASLETLAIIAYKQPVTVPEISEIRGVDSSGVIATLLDRKLITTAGRKAVIGRPILYKTTKEFLMRFGLKDVGELPSMEEFEKLVAESFQSDLLAAESEQSDATSGFGLSFSPVLMPAVILES
jgi:segregation and condensation protein B